MIERVAKYIVKKQVEKGIIKEEDISVYRYGYALIFEYGISIVVATLIGLTLDAFWVVCIFLAAFIPLRSFAGGYHTTNDWSCIILSSIIIIIAVCLVHSSIIAAITVFLIPVDGILGMILFEISPVGSKNKKLNERENIYYKKVVNKIFRIQFGIEIFLILIGFHILSSILFFSHLIVTISSLIERCHIKSSNKNS